MISAQAGLRGLKVGVDPGHGGEDPGAVGPTQLHEADVNLATALALKEFLERDGAEVFITRATNATVSLSSRTNYFNSNNVDRAISVHHNAATSSAPNYTLMYVYLGKCRTTSGDLAEVCSWRLVQSTQLSFGSSVCGRPGVTEDNFHMVRETLMPAILNEISFVSNPLEEQRLRNSSYLRANGWAIYAGVTDHYRQAPIPIQGLPVLELDAGRYCTGDTWKLQVANVASRSTLRLLGDSNGIPWEVPNWATADSNGTYSVSGTIAEGAEGTHALRIDAGGVLSNTVAFTVSRCEPRLALLNITHGGGASDTTSFCVRDAWRLEVAEGRSNAPIDLFGNTEGQDWLLAAFARTDAEGRFMLTGTFAENAAGLSTEHVVIAGKRSNQVRLTVSFCP